MLVLAQLKMRADTSRVFSFFTFYDGARIISEKGWQTMDSQSSVNCDRCRCKLVTPSRKGDFTGV